MATSDEKTPVQSDEELVAVAREGDRSALEELVRRYQPWVYNVALRMVWDPDDAQDVSQDVMIKLITKLSTFAGASKFSTWVYRITANHVINMKSSKTENMVTTFSAYGESLDGVPPMDPPDERQVPVDVKLVVEEAKIGCMAGMLLCLNREQRLVYILGELFGVTDRLGADILEISRANFRQRLSRARRDLYNFMNDKCGLIKKENPCRCARKTRGFIDLGLVDPANLRFASGHLKRIRDVAPKRSDRLDDILDDQYGDLFRQHPYAEPSDLAQAVTQMLDAPDLRAIFDLDP